MILQLPPPPLKMKDVGLELLEGEYNIIEFPHSTEELNVINTRFLELRTAISIKGERHPDINSIVEDSIFEAIEEGFYFAGARVVAALLENPEAIPKEWRKIADTDWFYEKSGGLSLLGSSLVPVDKERPSAVLSPFYARGRWHGGYRDLIYDEATVESVRSKGNHVLRDYFVVYRG